MQTTPSDRQAADASCTTVHPLTPADRAAMAQLRAMFAQLPSLPPGTAAREPFDHMLEQVPDAQGITYDADTVGGVPGWWCRPAAPAAGAAILYLHGGAYVVGSARAYRHLAGQVAARAGAATFVPEYRLAPEHPFPAAVVDGRACYAGLTGRGFNRIALCGDSAGGGLALVVVSQATADARRGVGVRPVGAALLSPWTDLTLTAATLTDRAAVDPMLTRPQLATLAGLYLGDADASDPRASPLLADPAGLPPIRVHVGDDEVLLDDARRLVTRAAAAGVDARVDVWQGMIHVFPSHVGHLQAATAALDDLGAFLADRLSA